jgi:hypothetical protein
MRKRYRTETELAKVHSVLSVYVAACDAEGNVIQEAPPSSMGEFSPEGVGYCDRGDYQEDRLEDRNPVAGKMEASAGNFGDFCDSGAS